jgi:hypothetical protein
MKITGIILAVTALITFSFVGPVDGKENEKKAPKTDKIIIGCDDSKDKEPTDSEELRLKPGKFHNKIIKLALEFKSVDQEDSEKLGVHAITSGKEKLHVLIYVSKKEHGAIFNNLEEGKKITACGKYNSSTLSGYTGGELYVPPVKME